MSFNTCNFLALTVLYCEVNPNSKIPAMLDYSFSPPLRVFESASILQYLAEKEKRFIPTDIRFAWIYFFKNHQSVLTARSGTGRGLNVSTGCIGCRASRPTSEVVLDTFTSKCLGEIFILPRSLVVGALRYAGQKIEYCIDRFSMETKRIVDVLDKQLQDKQFVIGDDYTIADMAILPWMNCLYEGIFLERLWGESYDEFFQDMARPSFSPYTSTKTWMHGWSASSNGPPYNEACGWTALVWTRSKSVILLKTSSPSSS